MEKIVSTLTIAYCGLSRTYLVSYFGVDILKLENSASNVEWNQQYPLLMRQRVNAYLAYEPILNKFCYSIHHLQPICDRPYWRRSY